MTPSRRPAARPPARRRTKTPERVLAAAAAILRRDGYARLTMERVAAESGVAKTTLYRRWATKAALCMDLYLEVAGRELHDPATGHVASDLQHIANTVVRLQTRDRRRARLRRADCRGADQPGDRAAFLAEFADRRREMTRLVLRRAIDRGELRANTDVDLVIDALRRRGDLPPAPEPRAAHHTVHPRAGDVAAVGMRRGPECRQERTCQHTSRKARSMIRRCTIDDVPEMDAIINDAAAAYRGVIPDDCWHRAV